MSDRLEHSHEVAHEKSMEAIIEDSADKEILDLLVESLVQSHDELEQAYRTKNIPILIKIIHKLNGGLCYSDTPQLRYAAEALEASLKNGEVDKLDEFYWNFIKAKENFQNMIHLLQ